MSDAITLTRAIRAHGPIPRRIGAPGEPDHHPFWSQRLSVYLDGVYVRDAVYADRDAGEVVVLTAVAPGGAEFPRETRTGHVTFADSARVKSASIRA